MSETEELRRLLDERGVKWWKASPRKTEWYSPVLGGPVAVSEWNGKMVLDAGYESVTPEQAIEATLGLGTCYAIDSGYATAFCSVCGAEFMGSIMTNEPPDYVKPLTRCPECGRKIIEVDDG